jgi:hypothetical protein
MLSKSKIRRVVIGPERGVLGKTESSYFYGIRVITIGGLIVILGVLIVAFGLENLGIVVVISGIAVAIIGLCVHVFLVAALLLKKRQR